MANIQPEIDTFKSAIYGEDVRNAMVSLANKINTASEASFTSKDTISGSDTYDLNSFTVNGCYLLESGPTYSNAPDGFVRGVLTVFKSKGTPLSQVLYTAGPIVYLRWKSATFGQWKRISFTDNSFTGLGKITSGTYDLNDAIVSGTMTLHTAATIVNAPEGFIAGQLIIFTSTTNAVDGAVFQILRDSLDRLWWRQRSTSGTWTQWHQFATGNIFQDRPQIGATEETGDIDFNDLTTNGSYVIRGATGDSKYLNTPEGFADGGFLVMMSGNVWGIQICYKKDRIWWRVRNVYNAWRDWSEVAVQSNFEKTIDMYNAFNSYVLKKVTMDKGSQAMCVHDKYLVCGIANTENNLKYYNIETGELHDMTGPDVGHINAVQYDPSRNVYWVSGWDDSKIHAVSIDYESNTYVETSDTIDLSNLPYNNPDDLPIRTTCGYCPDGDIMFVMAAIGSPVMHRNYELYILDMDGEVIEKRSGIPFTSHAIQDIHVDGFNAYIAHGLNSTYPSMITVISLDSLKIVDTYYFNGSFKTSEIEGITAENGIMYIGYGSTNVYRVFSN